MSFYSTDIGPTWGQFPNRIRLLVVADVDITSACALAEYFVPQDPQFDAIIACGPFTHSPFTTPEAKATAEGDIAFIIAQLESIVCRVIYLAAETDPSATLRDQLHLTPNSVNIHARRMLIRDNMHLSGFTEGDACLRSSKLPEDVDRSPDSDNELDGVEIKSGYSSIEIIRQILTGAEISPPVDEHKPAIEARDEPEQKGDGNATTSPLQVEAKSSSAIQKSQLQAGTETGFGIFILAYKFTHTLSHILFHMPEVLDDAGVKLCIIPSSSEDARRLPSRFGKLDLLVPLSLRKTGAYSIVEIAREENVSGSPDGGVERPSGGMAEWKIISKTSHQLGSN